MQESQCFHNASTNSPIPTEKKIEHNKYINRFDSKEHADFEGTSRCVCLPSAGFWNGRFFTHSKPIRNITQIIYVNSKIYQE